VTSPKSTLQAPSVLQEASRPSVTHLRPSLHQRPDPFSLPFGLYAKTGAHAYGVVPEALTLQSITDYTSIPFPDVLDFFNDPAHESGPMLVMSCVHGIPLSHTRQSLDLLSPNQLTTIADTLRERLNELQYIHSPFGHSVCGYLGNASMSTGSMPKTL
jgi:hypothetical protein